MNRHDGLSVLTSKGNRPGSPTCCGLDRVGRPSAPRCRSVAIKPMRRRTTSTGRRRYGQWSGFVLSAAAIGVHRRDRRDCPRRFPNQDRPDLLDDTSSDRALHTQVGTITLHKRRRRCWLTNCHGGCRGSACGPHGGGRAGAGCAGRRSEPGNRRCPLPRHLGGRLPAVAKHLPGDGGTPLTNCVRNWLRSSNDNYLYVLAMRHPPSRKSCT